MPCEIEDLFPFSPPMLIYLSPVLVLFRGEKKTKKWQAGSERRLQNQGDLSALLCSVSREGSGSADVQLLPFYECVWTTSDSTVSFEGFVCHSYLCNVNSVL